MNYVVVALAGLWVGYIAGVVWASLQCPHCMDDAAWDDGIDTSGWTGGSW